MNKGIISMKTNTGIMITTIAVAGVLALTGCDKKNQQAGVGERTGAALDEAAKKGAAKAEDVTEKVKNAAEKAVDKTGEVVEKVGEAADKAGEKLQK
jgi:hypothetical protein